METLAQSLNRETGDGIARLDGRQGARGFFGLTGRRAARERVEEADAARRADPFTGAAHGLVWRG